VFGIISLLPYLGLGNVATRYLYLASFGFTLSFVIVFYQLLHLFVAKNKHVVTLGIFALMVVLGVWFYAENRDIQKQWGQAGEITRNTIALFRTDYEQVAPPSAFFFVNTPATHNGIWVFPLGMRDGLWFVYQNKMPLIYQVNSVDEAKTVAGALGIGSYYIFSFDNQGTISPVK